MKTPREGGGGLRARWKDDDGMIYEWDSRHGEVEKYNARGRHVGVYDYPSGDEKHGAISGRKVEP